MSDKTRSKIRNDLAARPRGLPEDARRKQEVSSFLEKVAAMPTVRSADQVGRLIFAMDATASRQPTWDAASEIQAEMFQETAGLGALEVQLAYYRGFGEFKATRWVRRPQEVLRAMSGVTCLAGRTQIERVLRHARNTAKERRTHALVFVGDAVEENVDTLGHLAGELGVLSTPCFMFHEGRDQAARQVFEQIAALSGGACCSFDAKSADQLRALLGAVAVFAVGGRQALLSHAGRQGAQRAGLLADLTRQVR